VGEAGGQRAKGDEAVGARELLVERDPLDSPLAQLVEG
jgi:hypothetical protein